MTASTANLADDASTAFPKSALGQAEIAAAAQAACGRIAPLWPLKHFVAVNPFLGFSGRSFHATCAMLRRVARIKMLMPRDFYHRALTAGRLTRADLGVALSGAPSDWNAPRSLADLEALLAPASKGVAEETAIGAPIATVAEVLDDLASGDRQTSRTAFMVDEISKWCAAYFDEGQSVWRLPGRGEGPFAAWRQSMRHDLNPEVMGIKGFRALVASLPVDPMEAMAVVIAELGVPERGLEEYFYGALLDIGGWAAYARYLVWDNNLYGREDRTLIELLAIRVVWGWTLFRQRKDAAFQTAWSAAMAEAARAPLDEQMGGDPALVGDMILQEGYERAYQRSLLADLAAGAGRAPPTPPPFQAAFCIDVRSEVYRRALETVCPEAETIGFAGFFGYPIEYIPIGRETGGAQCPVLLTPAFTVCEAVETSSAEEETEVLGLRLLRRRVAKAWKSFKLSAVSSFLYVETAGLTYASKILSDSLGLTRTVHDPNTDGFDADVIDRLGPRIEPRRVAGRETGFTPEQKIVQAESVLRAMSMTGDFARIVLLAGHGSTTVNNPHASGLDCGACGGHTGEANARVAATILNDPEVRLGLVARGIVIPAETWFLGALHDTTTDEVRLFDAHHAPAPHAEDIARLRAWLGKASALARRERGPALGLTPDATLDGAVKSRSRDWSQVRPEWGLAGNAAFIAAPRRRTLGVDLKGRAFLHSYDWRLDDGFGVLELIMSAPMVVASWINLQYYASTVNNPVFGAGNKVLHNVTGALGVLEGNGGDLKVGLPWQSVHDGRRFMHEPLRLNVIIEAPREAMDQVIARQDMVRDLVMNGWLHLFAMDDEGRVSHQHARHAGWRALV
jgi:uncharacterized protein YbcC (UPF0753/DUF2309 family)